MHKYFVAFFIGMLFFINGMSQNKNYIYTDSELINTDKVETNNIGNPNDNIKNKILVIDTTLYYKEISVSKYTIDQWKKAKDFDYINNLDSLLKNKSKNEEFSNVPINSSGGWVNDLFTSNIFKIILWGIVLFFVIYILYKLLLTQGVFINNKKNKNAISPNLEDVILNTESDFEKLINDAIKLRNYKLAIRYHYLQILNKLADKNLISLSVDKTNYQYVSEINNKSYQNEFASLTLNYDYVWYGNFDITELNYTTLDLKFKAFIKQIN